MKKIVILLVLILLLTISSCGLQEKNSEDNNEKKIETKKNINDKLTKLEDLVNNQKFDEAIPELEKLYNSNPNEINNILNYMSALLAKGSITRQEKKYSKKALEIGNKALKLFPKNSELYRHIGYAYEIAEDYKNAFKNYNKSIELDSNNADAYVNRGHAYRLYGDRIKAENDFMMAYKLDPNNDYVLLNMGWLLSKEGITGMNEALKYYNLVIKNSKNIRFKSEAYYAIGYIYIAKGKYDKAEKAFKNAIKIEPKYELGYLGLSETKMLKLIYKIKDDNKKVQLIKDALKNNDIAISLNPTRAISYMKKGLILKDIKKHKKDSILMLHLALDAIPNDISLGKNEKKQLKIYINNLLKNEN